MDKLGYLSRINIMEVLPQDALMEVERIAPMSVARKGSVIMEPGSRREVLYLLKDGRVRIYKMNAEGRQFTTGLLGPGNFFGEVSTFSTGTHDAWAEALEDTVLCLLRKPDVDRLMQEHPPLALKFVEILSARLKQAQDLMGYLAMETVRSRLLYLLLRLAAEFGADEQDGWTLISADLSHQDLAGMIGSTRETVSVTVNTLAREQIVRTGRKEIWVHADRARADLNP